jgi:hypothetical protein
MQSDILNPRRAPRVPVRCGVHIRHRLATFAGETEDIGRGGCQLVSERVIEPGREVTLEIRSEALGRTVTVAGKVVWVRREEPIRLGVAFDGGIDRRWFEALLRSDPEADRFSRSVPERLARPTRVYLGRAPTHVVDFTPTELELMRRVGAGVTLDALARSFGHVLHDRTRGALFSLVARRVLVLDARAASSESAWRHVLPERDGDAAAPLARLPSVQRLYDEALGHISAGRFSLAVHRLREAHRLAPADEAIASTVHRLARWA